VKVPFIDFSYELEEFENNFSHLLNDHLKKGEFIGGESVKNFEDKLQEYLGVNHVVTVGNGTDALLIALLSLGLKNKEVIVPAFSFFATSEAVVQAGLKPVFVDIEYDNCNIDVSKIEQKITAETGAILPVHLFGNSADMKAIQELSSSYNLKIVEDVAQSFGTKYKNKQLGTIGDFGCFSFFPTKTLGAYGDGGAIATNDSELAETARMYKNHGSKIKYFNEVFGYNSRLDSIQASILSLKLEKIDLWIKKRIEAGKYYDNELKEVEEIALLNNENSSYNYYSLFVKNNQRDSLRDFLSSKNISTAIYYPKTLPSLPAHNESSYDFPIAENICKEIVSLPIWPGIEKKQLIYVIESIKEFFKI